MASALFLNGRLGQPGRADPISPHYGSQSSAHSTCRNGNSPARIDLLSWNRPPPLRLADLWARPRTSRVETSTCRASCGGPTAKGYGDALTEDRHVHSATITATGSRLGAAPPSTLTQHAARLLGAWAKSALVLACPVAGGARGSSCLQAVRVRDAQIQPSDLARHHGTWLVGKVGDLGATRTAPRGCDSPPPPNTAAQRQGSSCGPQGGLQRQRSRPVPSWTRGVGKGSVRNGTSSPTRIRFDEVPRRQPAKSNDVACQGSVARRAPSESRPRRYTALVAGFVRRLKRGRGSTLARERANSVRSLGR